MRESIAHHPKMNARERQAANQVLMSVKSYDCRCSDGVGSRGSFYEFICRDFLRDNPSFRLLDVAALLVDIAEKIDPGWQSLATANNPPALWVARCLAEDGVAGREEFLEALYALVGDHDFAFQKMMMWARAATYVNLFADSSLVDLRNPANWQARVDAAEIARVLLTLDHRHMGRAARLYVHTLGPSLTHQTDMHADLIRALRDLPPELWFAEDSGAGPFLERFILPWLGADAEARRESLASWQAVSHGLCADERDLVLRAVEKMSTDPRKLPRVAYDAPTSLARTMQLWGQVPRHLGVDYAKFVLTHRRALTLEGAEAQMLAFVGEAPTPLAGQTPLMLAAPAAPGDNEADLEAQQSLDEEMDLDVSEILPVMSAEKERNLDWGPFLEHRRKCRDARTRRAKQTSDKHFMLPDRRPIW